MLTPGDAMPDVTVDAALYEWLKGFAAECGLTPEGVVERALQAMRGDDGRRAEIAGARDYGCLSLLRRRDRGETPAADFGPVNLATHRVNASPSGSGILSRDCTNHRELADWE